MLGTMYSYDIFAAVPCCPERLKVFISYAFCLKITQKVSFYNIASEASYIHFENFPIFRQKSTLI